MKKTKTLKLYKINILSSLCAISAFNIANIALLHTVEQIHHFVRRNVFSLISVTAKVILWNIFIVCSHLH